MIENLSILVQFLIFILFFSFPLNIFNKKYLFKNYTLTISDCYCLNIIFHLNFFLLASFFDANQVSYFYSIIFLTVLFNIFYLREYLKFYHGNKDCLVNFLFFSIIVIGLFLNIASEAKLEWDALAHWVWKTTSFYEDMGIKNIKNLPFPDYPHLGPYVWSFFWKNSFMQYEYFGRLFYLFFYVVAIFSIITCFFKKTNFIKYLLIILFILLTYDAYMFSGYQEYLLFIILIIISRFSFLFNKDPKYLFILIFSSHLLMWIKDEGLFYYIIFTIPFIIIANYNVSKKLIIISLCLMFPIIQFFLQKYLIGHYGFQADIISSSLLDLLDYKILFPKIILIIKYILISMVKYKLWLINIATILIITLYSSKLYQIFRIYLWILFLNFAFIFAVYLHTPYFSEFLLRVTLDRLLFHTSGFFLPMFLVLTSKIIIDTDHKISNT